MTTAQAVRLALRAIAAECRRLAVDANLADLAGADWPEAVKAAQLRRQYRQAADVLAGLAQPETQPAAGRAGNGAKGKA